MRRLAICCVLLLGIVVGNLGQPAAESQANRLQQRMLNDADTMRMITSLRSHPDIQAILSDPSIMQAIQSGKLDNLLSHPKFQKLLRHSTVQEIIKKHKK